MAALVGLVLGSVSIIGCLGFVGRQLEGLFEATGDAIDPRPVSLGSEVPPSVAVGNLTWVTVPASEGVIGDDGTSNVESDEKPRFRVRFTRSFQMLETEVTNRQYAAKNSGHSPVNDKPVVKVNWSDAQTYCAAIGARLPTELEWEYAARAGGEGAYGLGAGGVEVTEANLQSYAWLTTNSGDTVRDVRQREPNAWGLYDLWGNVWEWVEDGYSGEAWAALSASGTLLTSGARLVTDPGFVATIGDNGANTPPSHRVFRGGSAWGGPKWLRSGDRLRNESTSSGVLLGFRCVLAAAPQPLNLAP
jgi:formylglycine-generating enzyme required for sulfatase activity